VDDLVKDVRYALRVLAKSPGFTLVAVLSIALGIGVNTSIFSLVNAVLLRPVPVSHPESLVEVYTTSSDLEYSTSSYPDYLDLRRDNDVFEDVAGHSLMFAPVTRDGVSRAVIGEIVTGNYFDLVGVGAEAGRTFLPEEGAAEGAPPVVVLGHGLWVREYGSDPGAIGRTLRLRGLDYTIVGVMPASFTGTVPGFSPELWITTAMVEEVEPIGIQNATPSPGRTMLERRGRRWLFLTARLKPGVTIDAAQANVDVVMSRLAQAYPGTNRDRKGLVVARGDVRIHPMVDGLLTPGAALLMSVVGLVLLIACANVANLLLARGASRRREIAVRLAIGAGRRRLVRQLLTESLVLSALGAAGGLALASLSTRLLLALQPPLPFTLELDLGFDGRVFLFALGAAAIAGVAFGLAPALQASSASLVTNLKDEGALADPSAGRFGLRNVLVVGQVTVSMVLLVAAALFLRSLAAARAVDPGVDVDRIALAALDLDMLRYPEARSRRFFDELLDRLRALPGVEAAALAQREPLSLNVSSSSIYVPGHQATPDDPAYSIDATEVSPGYFEALGIPIVAGRDFTDADTPDSPGVVVISQAMADRFWPGESAIGRRLQLRGPDGPPYEIVGVSADYKVRTIGETPRPYVHFAHAQRFSAYAIVMVRARGSAAEMIAPLRQALLAAEPDLVIMAIQPLAASIAATLFPARAAAVLVGLFGLLALALAAVGLYGVIAYSVSRRTREIGIRMALGAEPGAVLRLVLRQGLTLVAVGIGLGGMAAVWAARLVAGSLYGAGAADPLAYAGAAALLVGVAAVANVVPALRAARVDPMVALRQG